MWLGLEGAEIIHQNGVTIAQEAWGVQDCAGYIHAQVTDTEEVVENIEPTVKTMRKCI
jgi:hypothetical protein